MSDTPESEPFFVGYLKKMPAPHAAKSRAFAIAAALVAGGALAIAAIAQDRIDNGIYEFGVYTQYEGVLYAEPVPMLRTFDSKSGASKTYVLVGATKVGLPEEIRQQSGKKVKFQGSAIRRGTQEMIEFNSPDSFQVLGEPSAQEARAAGESLGRMTLRGEVIDTKCFFGAMRPAIGKIHRGCAIRCLSGGVPAALRVVDPNGKECLFLLAGQPGNALDLDVQLAGLFVEVTGQVELQENVAVLHVEAIRRTRGGTP